MNQYENVLFLHSLKDCLMIMRIYLYRKWPSRCRSRYGVWVRVPVFERTRELGSGLFMVENLGEGHPQGHPQGQAAKPRMSTRIPWIPRPERDFCNWAGRLTASARGSRLECGDVDGLLWATPATETYPWRQIFPKYSGSATESCHLTLGEVIEADFLTAP